MTGKKWGVFLALLVLLGGAAALLFWDTGAECLSVLRTGQGAEEYALAAAGPAGGYFALGWRGERLQLVKLDSGGQRESLWLLPEDLPRRIRPAVLYPASGGAVYLGLYDLEQEPAELRLYRITEQGKAAELLLREPCQGQSLQEQLNSVGLSAFSEVDSVVTFAVVRGDTAQFYQRVSAASGLEQLGTVTRRGLRTVLALSDGTLLLAGEEGLLRLDGGTETLLSEAGRIVSLLQAGTGVYYIDGTSLAVFYFDLAGGVPASYLGLEKEAYDLDRCTGLSVTRDGDALLLMEGKGLLLDRGSAVSDLSAALYRPRVQCGLILAALAAGVLAVTLVLWYAICQWQRFRLPLLVQWGGLTVAAAALSVGILLRWGVAPASEAAAEREAFSLMNSVASLAFQGPERQDHTLSLRLGRSLAEVTGGLYRDAAVSVYRLGADGRWRLSQSNTALPMGSRAELSPSFDRELVALAAGQGTAQGSRAQEGGRRWVLYRAWGDRVLAIDVDGAGLLAWSRENCRWMAQAITALAALLAALSLAILCGLSIGLRKVARGMEQIAAGQRGIALRLGGGGELAGLAGDLNALSGALEGVERTQSELAGSYRRFVPEQLLPLLGKNSITEVDKQTCANRELTAMMLRFQLPQEVYEHSGRELFDSINEILERTACLVAAQGGAVFNFTYDGYDAVFPQGSAAGVSAAVAVQQEILELNREREAAGRGPVVVRIALDEGNVMIGVVGDEKQIQPTSVSSSFSMARQLIALCGELQAGILCTEAVIAGASGYASRYMGKCTGAEEDIRVYEIFDGDPYEVRKVKQTTGGRFSEGVYALYSRDFSRAKGIFLSLVHANTGDGGARYYLYLADELEKRPAAEIRLDQREPKEGEAHGRPTAYIR